MSVLTELERTVLEMMLAGDDECLLRVRHQVEMATVKDRRLTNVGFYTLLDVADRKGYRLGNDAVLVWGDIIAEVGGITVAFELHFRDGVISSLEGFSFGQDEWPTSATRQDFKLKYVREPRSLISLKKYLS